MVPPPGAPAEVGFDAFEVGIFVYLKGGPCEATETTALRATSSDLLAFTSNPTLNVLAQLWGDPSSSSHNEIRGRMPAPGPKRRLALVAPRQAALFTMPSPCSWSDHHLRPRRHLGGTRRLRQKPPTELPTSTATRSRSPAARSEFDPTLTAQPHHQPHRLPLGPRRRPPPAPEHRTRPPRHRRPSETPTSPCPRGWASTPPRPTASHACSNSADRLPPEAEGIHFSKDAPSCPDASKLGTVEVTTPLLAQYSEDGTTLANRPRNRTGDPPSAAGLRLPRPAQRKPLRLPARDLPLGRRPPIGHRRQARRRSRSPTPRPARSPPSSKKTPSCRSKTSASTSSAAPAAP